MWRDRRLVGSPLQRQRCLDQQCCGTIARLFGLCQRIGLLRSRSLVPCLKRVQRLGQLLAALTGLLLGLMVPPEPAAKGHQRENDQRSEEHTSELQSLMRISYAVFCLKKKNNQSHHHRRHTSDNI